MFDRIPPKVVVVIPCYRVKAHIAQVLSEIPHRVDQVLLVDDACPEGSGEFVESLVAQKKLPDLIASKVQVLYHAQNQGVGGATLTGYHAALKLGADIAVKVDGDGQMDLALLPKFIEPILANQADYTKGNRFYYPRAVSKMPWVRLIGNAGLSFLNKLSSGYWNIMDPTNGYTALRLSLLPELSPDKISRRYFFESDMLFRLGLAQARVVDIPMAPKYEDEVSNLSVMRSLVSFPGKHLKRLLKRVLYQYFIRDFNVGSVFLLLSLPNLLFGLIWGALKWAQALQTQLPTPTGTLFLIALALIVGFQSLIGFLLFDVQARR
jgi:glycosyltransferase involved in cell wall biosynthesis